MGKNLVRETFVVDGAWVCPAGVTTVKANVVGTLGKQVGVGWVDGVSYGIDANGHCYSWGTNTNGQWATGSASVGTARSSPVLIASAPLQSIGGLVAVTPGGAALAWGFNTNGQLGNNTGDAALPASIPVFVWGGNTFRRVSGVSAANFGVSAAGAIYAWGKNTNGQLGVGDVTPRSSPVLVLGGFTWRSIANGLSNGHMAAVRSTNAAYAWGANGDGQLGVGDVTPRSSPVAVLGGLSFSEVSCGTDSSNPHSFTMGLTTSGALYAWGYNANGQLGVGDVVPRSSPVAVLGGLKFRAVCAGPAFVYAIAANGDLYAWGDNTNGQLGNGANVTPQSSPTLVVGGLKWTSVVAGVNSTGAGGYGLGIATNGSAYGWGYNAKGSIGDGTAVTKSSPVLVVGGYKWRAERDTILVQEYLAVVPGTSYTVTILAGVLQLGPYALFTDDTGNGAVPVSLVLEYQA